MGRALKDPNAVLVGRSFRDSRGKVVTLIRRDRSGNGLFRDESGQTVGWMRTVAVESMISRGALTPLGKLKNGHTSTSSPDDSASSEGPGMDQAEGRIPPGRERRTLGDVPRRVPTEDQPCLFADLGR